MNQAVRMPVHINFSSEINDGEDKVDFSFQTIGQYYIMNHKSYLMFEEKLEDQAEVNTLIRWSEEEAWIKRSGSVNMRVLFKLKQETSGIYETPQVKLEVKAHTDRLMHSWDERDRSGLFQLKYTLFMQGESIGTYSLEIQFKEE
ncbi:DUF1934 domain-containing protein [Bacillus sp. DJP31]|uniref:DUF1934 domain-containing protein n=1 Tax=Bacillus sp. DJP31 TaxID=3409789 RepID=UPI003BB72CEC